MNRERLNKAYGQGDLGWDTCLRVEKKRAKEKEENCRKLPIQISKPLVPLSSLEGGYVCPAFWDAVKCALSLEIIFNVRVANRRFAVANV